MPLNSIESSAKSLWNAVRFLWIPLGSRLKCLWYALYALWIPFGSLSKIPFQGPGIHMNSLGMLIEIHYECLRIPTNSLGIPIEISLECFRILVNSFGALVNASMSEVRGNILVWEAFKLAGHLNLIENPLWFLIDCIKQRKWCFLFSVKTTFSSTWNVRLARAGPGQRRPASSKAYPLNTSFLHDLTCSWRPER